jgi:hypothetical protein
VQIAIKAVLNYSDPIRSPTGSDLVPQDVVTDPMPGHSENYYTYGLVRYLHGGKSGMNVAEGIYGPDGCPMPRTSAGTGSTLAGRPFSRVNRPGARLEPKRARRSSRSSWTGCRGARPRIGTPRDRPTPPSCQASPCRDVPSAPLGCTGGLRRAGCAVETTRSLGSRCRHAHQWATSRPMMATL